MKLTSYRSTCTARGPTGPLNSNSIICSMSIFLAIFLKYFVRKNWRGGGESLLKNGPIDGYAY